MTAAARPTDVMAVASRWVVSSVAVQFAKAMLLFGSQINDRLTLETYRQT